MFADHLSLHLIGIDVEMLRQMNAEPQAVEEGAGAQHASVPRAAAGYSGESTSTANPSRTNDSNLHDLNSHSQISSIDVGQAAKTIKADTAFKFSDSVRYRR